MDQKILKETIAMMPNILRLNLPHLWFDYDCEADVLYVHTQKPSRASDSELLENDVLVRKYRNKPIGYTILNASRFR